MNWKRVLYALFVGFVAALSATAGAIVGGRIETTITQAVEKVGPAVVTVIGTIPGQMTFFGRTADDQSSGSGVIISPNGYIVTNNHVVEDASELAVILSDGAQLPAQVISTDIFADLAVLKYVGAEVGFGNWIYTYAITLGLGDTFTAAYLTSAFWGTFTLGRLLGVWTSTKARAAAILFIDLLGCLLSLGLILLWGDSATALWIGTIGLGLFMASVFPTILILAGERMAITGAVTGLPIS